MKPLATLITAAVLVTSPISASAQTSSDYEQCTSGCSAAFQAARDHCNERYGEGGWWGIDRDWCEYEASLDNQACWDACWNQYPQTTSYDVQTQRFRPVVILV